MPILFLFVFPIYITAHIQAWANQNKLTYTCKTLVPILQTSCTQWLIFSCIYSSIIAKKLEGVREERLENKVGPIIRLNVHQEHGIKQTFHTNKKEKCRLSKDMLQVLEKHYVVNKSVKQDDGLIISLLNIETMRLDGKQAFHPQLLSAETYNVPYPIRTISIAQGFDAL